MNMTLAKSWAQSGALSGLLRFGRRRWKELGLGLVILMIFFGLRGCADGVFFAPTRGSDPLPAGAEDVVFAGPGGSRLHGWFVKPTAGVGGGGASAPYPAVLHCHGNAGSIGVHWPFSRFLTNAGYAVFVFDYRGYGESSDGKVSRASILEDSRAALAYLRSRSDVDAGRIVVMGMSLGGSPAVEMVAEDQGSPPVKALLTMCAFDSWVGVASEHVPVLPYFLLSRGHDPDAAARRLPKGLPWLIVHGDNDVVVPEDNADLLEAAGQTAGARVSKEIVRGAGHVDLWNFAGAQEGVVEFLKREVGGGG